MRLVERCPWLALADPWRQSSRRGLSAGSEACCGLLLQAEAARVRVAFAMQMAGLGGPGSGTVVRQLGAVHRFGNWANKQGRRIKAAQRSA